MNDTTNNFLTNAFAEICKLPKTVSATEKLSLVTAALAGAQALAEEGHLSLPDRVFLNTPQIMDALSDMFSESECRNYNYHGEAVNAVQSARSVISIQTPEATALS